MFNNHKNFINACKNGNLQEAQHILQLNTQYITEPKSSYSLSILDTAIERQLFTDIFMITEYACLLACEKGHLAIVQWLYSAIENNPNINLYHLFKIACQNGHLHIAQWIYSIPNEMVIKIYEYHDLIFEETCIERHLHVAQWLQSLMPFRYNIENQDQDNNIIWETRSKKEINALSLLWLFQKKGWNSHINADLFCKIAA